MKLLKSKFEYIDSQIQQGNMIVVKRFIMEHLKNAKNLSRGDFLILSQFAKRSGDYYLALKAFKNLMPEKQGGVGGLAVEEKILFASLQARIGAPQKSIEILTEMSQDNEEVVLNQAFSYVYLWQYRKAIPLLNQYLSLSSGESYSTGIGQVNLLAALSFTQQYDLAKSLFENIYILFEKNKWDLLKFNALEIMTGCLFNSGDLLGAQRLLKRALSINLNYDMSRYRLFLEKWEVAIQWAISQDHEYGMNKIIELKNRSFRLGLWNTVREIDYLMAHLQKNTNLLDRVYFGSPYKEYRTQLRNRNPWYTPAENYVNWYGSDKSSIFDIDKSMDLSSKLEIHPGSMDHQILKILNYDFYKQTLKGELFYFLYPGQYFDPDSSPRRIYVAIQRLRKSLSNIKIPMSVEIKDNVLSLLECGRKSGVDLRIKLRQVG